jgi:outer membrane lipoprotein-sorting protein
LTGSFPLTIETPNAIATQIVNVLFYGLPIGELQNFRERVNAVTVADIQRVARLYLKPDHLSVVLVGNANEFMAQLRGKGFPSYESVDIQNLDLTSADFKRVRRAQADDVGRPFQARHDGDPERVAPHTTTAYAAQSAVGQNPARVLLDRVITAMGGLAALRGVKTIVARQTVIGPPGQGNTETTSYIEYPSKFRVEANTPYGMLVSGFDGNAAWARDPQGVHDAPPEMTVEARNNLKRDVIRLLLDAQANQLMIRLLQDVRSADGRPQRVLELTGTDQNPIVLDIDAETFRVTKESYAAGAGGQALVDEAFSDYRVVDGVQMPFAAERRAGPLVIRRRVTDIQINRPVDPQLFARPAS